MAAVLRDGAWGCSLLVRGEYASAASLLRAVSGPVRDLGWGGCSSVGASGGCGEVGGWAALEGGLGDLCGVVRR